MEEEALLSGVGDREFRNNRERVKEAGNVEKLLNPKAANGESSTEPSQSSSALPTGVPIEINLHCSYWSDAFLVCVDMLKPELPTLPVDVFGANGVWCALVGPVTCLVGVGGNSYSALDWLSPC